MTMNHSKGKRSYKTLTRRKMRRILNASMVPIRFLSSKVFKLERGSGISRTSIKEKVNDELD